MNKFTAIVAAGAVLTLSPAHVGAQAAAKPISMGMQLEQKPERPAIIGMAPDRTGAALGFKVGDILLEAGGQPVSAEVVRAYMKDKKAGDELHFKVKRGDSEVELRGRGVAAPEAAPATAAQPKG